MLASALRAAPDLDVVGHINLNRIATGEHKPLLETVRADHSIGIVSLHAGAGFGELSTKALRDAGHTVTTYTNIHFEGLHPDIVRMPPFPGSEAFPTGVYHSRIALRGFLEGWSVSDTVLAFNGETYRQSGYFQAFERSAGELRRRDARCDVAFANAFLEMARERPVLFTVNHPTQRPVVALASRIAKALTGKPMRVPADFFPNPLASDVFWPVYPEIAAEIGARYFTPMRFGTPREGRPFLALPNFVRLCHNAYGDIGRDHLLKFASDQIEAVNKLPLPIRREPAQTA